MARYIVRVRTPMSPAEVFAFMADLRNLEKWDPGVVSSEQVAGSGVALESAYDVTVVTGSREMTLRYEVTEFDPPRRIRAVAKARWFSSIDEIEVVPTTDGTIAVYDATLKMPFPLSLGDRLLARTFDRIGDKAAEGMKRALGGELVR